MATNKPQCDSCFTRKVRCDRGNPCGNCQDRNAICSRQRVIKRIKRTTRLAVIESNGETRPKSSRPTSRSQDAQNLSLGPHDNSVVTSNRYPRPDYQQYRGPSPGSDKSLSHHDSHVTIRYHRDKLEWLPVNSRQKLESGLRRAFQPSESFEGSAHVASEVAVNEKQTETPSIELLAWMIKDIKEDSFGSFVGDYFRHICGATLEQMALTLLHRSRSPHDLLISTVCVNAMASKFLTTIIHAGIDSELIHELANSLVQFQTAAKAALQNTALLMIPSLGLLQALLSGIFLHQGSGDLAICWELTKAACRVCVCLGLDTVMKTGGSLSEEQYYCLAWCYMLDTNFAFKMGRFKTLLDIHIGHFTLGLFSYRRPIADLFQIHMALAGVQAAVVPYLKGRSSMSIGGDLATLHGIREHWLADMQLIQERIEHVSRLHPAWKGLDAQSELSAVRFAYYSVMAAIFHITENADNQSGIP
ncbi:hypothetical protein N7522_000553 [Penicillium canescens]|uniref:Zn(2)-C6 fungal-type domain-containing protein n=1 Tax=Penicillium canescens TaxID=5083 RepID=A0AAD6N849_PENCN|nr:uncharacterized protein N7446_011917 [Penicillium canescens]KAJ6019845.1 hypothetical protein N7522_000553 [Penicillium canescens]KAJ6039143.1 hypothetical protein N7460_007175 [Penicillium canescens]KAJ6047083.1 hypothetical protein N7446_011917 [Penicillium canescens]